MKRLYFRYILVAVIVLFAIYALRQSFPVEYESDQLAMAVVTCPTPEALERSEKEYESPATEIVCRVDGKRNYTCLRDEDDVYFPFEQFLKKQFDASGKLVKGKGMIGDHFEWSTSYSKMRLPDEGDYDPKGPFGHFASYSVESRDRVRCISAQYGVPMSTQWSPRPYFYPIQIAQYALQHYSRNKTGDEAAILEVGSRIKDWYLEASDGDISDTLHQDYDEELKTNVMELVSQDEAVRLNLNESTNLDVLSFWWKSGTSASFTIVAEIVQWKTMVNLHYVHKSDGRCVWIEGEPIKADYYYELGSEVDASTWRMMCRDVLVDVSRALATTTSGKKNANTLQLHPGDVRALSLTVKGEGVQIREVKQRSSAHMERFLVTANWFINNQDQRGGWSVPVERSIADKRLILAAGWHSAMAQGHALSVLTRAYYATNDIKYLKAASKALLLFKLNASSGGVRNDLFGHWWYEEYPTQPGTFVLNGFMYSLIGLYELSLVPEPFKSDSKQLFSQGVDSLLTFLPLFDTGSGSVYDLRHLGLKTAPNLARWDYHSVHIYLLKWLYNITNHNQLNETAMRWMAYAQGKRAKHN